MIQLAEKLKALSDPTRLRVLRLLDHGELCVCDLMEGLDLPQSKVSRHMSFLKNAGWVQSQRKGKWVYYSLAHSDDNIQAAMQRILCELLPDRDEAKEDYARLLAFLKTKKADSCSTDG
ncbi:metalloregulator ArsR/SmtB family transcription factor [Pseudodesulfovibrio sp. zrk46]|uniref:ArsR/SmtB family transcription factor n=1 Tax=Pseudodesulfovibrio sp. zrk46 TaxID=2725288 RepID=UPI001449E95A|nr:metalloregulator ArsR/SmtB family transcription factor [Pseudodesulfovibrio sp. zrk46]QJB55158.1 winged helix-turn-helix transcriptional regulator [Pseudodesulfovibrio sp. zrk46]